MHIISLDTMLRLLRASRSGRNADSQGICRVKGPADVTQDEGFHSCHAAFGNMPDMDRIEHLTCMHGVLVRHHDGLQWLLWSGFPARPAACPALADPPPRTPCPA